MADLLNLESAIRKSAPTFAKAIEKVAEATPGNEAAFRTRAWKLIDDFSTEHDLGLESRDEYRLFNGRADAVYNRFVIEYEPPGSLRANLTLKANQHAVGQVKDYLSGLVRRERHRPERLAGVAWDGHWFIFVMHSDAGWRVEDPVPVDDSSCERFLSLLASLNLERAVQPEYLIKDFGENSRVARLVVSTLYDALGKSDVPFVKVMFDQWSMQFKEVCDYEKTSKLKLEDEAAKFAVKGKDIDPFRFFFCLHTYYATFIKLLAVQIVQFYLMPKFGTNLRQAASADDARLKAFMDKLERGGIFKDFGINNFLEGDFFKWYVEAWDDKVAAAMRETIKVLANYSLVTLDVDPNTTRDILKVLYQGLVPKKLRHNLGEYYTPDWLAERLINMTVVGDLKPTDKVLDPACGSGTFLVLCIKKMREYARKKGMNESEVLDKILLNVVGFDLNPLAVISSRTNYLLALGDLLEHRKGDISLPVYLCDSVVTPHEGEDIFGKDRFKIKTAVGDFTLPKSVIRRDLIKRMAEALEEMVEVELDRDAAIERLASELGLDRAKNAVDLGLLADLHEQLLEKKKQRINGVWARVIKNAFAPLFLKNFDYIVGNPPWVNWRHLPEQYRRTVAPLWISYGIFEQKGMRAAYTNDDLSALMTYVVIDKNLKPTGRLGFLVTQALLKTASGSGFRKFLLPDTTSLGVVHVDDMSELRPFPNAENRTAALVLQRGRPTNYGKFTYWMWLKRDGWSASLPQDASWNDIESAVRFRQFVAEPVDPVDSTSHWLTGPHRALAPVRKALGEADYQARVGLHPGGANGVFWVRKIAERPGGLSIVANMAEEGEREIESIQAPVEDALLYKSLRGRDVARWHAVPASQVVVTHLPGMRLNAIPEADMKTTYPHAYAYLRRFEDALRKRGTWQVKQAIQAGKPFYSMSAIGDYTFSTWKVVWREQAAFMTAAVAGPDSGRPIMPDHKLMLVAVPSSREGHYLAAVLNSSIVRWTVAAYAVCTQIAPNVLQFVAVPKYQGQLDLHTHLARLSERAHKIAAKLDKKQVAESPEIKAIEEEIDLQAAKLWGLSDKELKEIKLALEELR